ncbi:MAG TPA: 2-aminoethylphosphonate--pyruvate transaminase [Polyangiales bacterium]|nr:2-aminoethylphosphonate--pyruvate transaminase [Polyangiales bacterium]
MSTLQPVRKILLNPGPATTTDRVKRAQIVSDVCPREREFGAVVSAVREKLVRVPEGADGYTAVLLGGSGTAAMEACISSLLPADGHLLIAANGAYGDRAIKIAQAYGLSHTPLKLDVLAPIDLGAVERALAEQPRTTHLFFVHHETTTGLLNPFERLAQLCKQRGITAIVDAVSSYAGLPIDLQRAPVDFLFSSSNKCVQGFAGLGLVLCKRAALQATERYPRRGVYLNLFDNWKAQEADGQCLFTPPVQVIYALDAALDELFEETPKKRYARYAACYDTLMRGMDELGLSALLPREYHCKLLTTFVDPELPGYDFEAMHDYLFARDITIYPGKLVGKNTFRIANIGALEPADIERFLAVLGEYLSSLR